MGRAAAAPRQIKKTKPTKASRIGAARTLDVPEYEAQLATLVTTPPEGDEWLHEQKYDGYRIGVRIVAGHATLWSRSGQDWSAEFPTIVTAAEALGVRAALLDGELCAVLPTGITSFQGLQQRSAATTLTYFAFDLLHEDGEDLRAAPLEERKRRLAALLRAGSRQNLLRYSDHVAASGAAFFREVCRLGLEGMVSKRRTESYRAGRNLDWQKTKCSRRQELVVGGFTEPEGGREGVGALLLGHYDGGDLRWAGKVGTGAGWNTAYLRELRRKLDRLSSPKSFFSPPVSDAGVRRKARWVKPELVVEVAFTEWTADGRIRHPSVQGLRTDKRASEVHREIPRGAVPSKTSPRGPAGRHRSDVLVAGISISHPERILFPELGVTKADVARYYERVAERMLPHLVGRPLTLLRCFDTLEYDAPGGKAGCMMIKHAKAWGPSALRRVNITEVHKTGEYLVADDGAGLVSLAQMGVVEVHTWNARAEAPYLHDRIVLDVDPGSRVGWPAVMEAALRLRVLLKERGLESWVKTTGGRGLHVVAPVAPSNWEVCLTFARAVADALVAEAPGRYTVAMPKAGREAKILLDMLRNNRANTSVAAYSLRARRGAPVSVPLSWDELVPQLEPASLTLASIGARLANPDPWSAFWKVRQRLP